MSSMYALGRCGIMIPTLLASLCETEYLYYYNTDPDCISSTFADKHNDEASLRLRLVRRFTNGCQGRLR